MNDRGIKGLGSEDTPRMGYSDPRTRSDVRDISGFPSEAALCLQGASWIRQVLVLGLLMGAALFLMRVVGDVQFWMQHRIGVVLTLGGLACWRWSWFACQNVRAIVYRYFVFPRLRREAQEAVAQLGPVPGLCILATTYHEKPWITRLVFESVFEELSRVTGLQRRPKLVVVTGCKEDDLNIRKVYARHCENFAVAAPALWPPELVLLRGDTGKRAALALGMEEIVQGNPAPDGVVLFMDADTILQPGLLQKVLPLFRLSPPVAAVTTNETARVKGPPWFAEWISLRFGLRHRTMCSMALSGKLLCLTGRLSIFRASVVQEPSFRKQVEKDLIEHWLWGSFEMLSGDDKSTWYWLAAHAQRMLYVPDAVVTTLEVVTGSALKRAYANIRRWSGNSLRHSWRAIELGPRKLGLFPWWSLLDQRIAMGTVLVGPAVLLLALWCEYYEVAAGYLLWVLASRVNHAAIAWYQGRRFSAYYIPLQVLSDWAVALTKFWVLFHPGKQNWLNRGNRTLNAVQGSTCYGLRNWMAHYLSAFSCGAIVIAVGLYLGFVPIFREARLFLHAEAERPTAPPLLALSTNQPPRGQHVSSVSPQAQPVPTAALEDSKLKPLMTSPAAF